MRWVIVCLMFWTGPAFAAGSSFNSDTRAMTALFLDACVEGKVDLSRFSGQEVSHTASEWYDARGSSSAKRYRIRRPRSGYVVVADYSPPTRDGQTKLCMLNFNGTLNFALEVSEVQKRLFGQSSPPNRRAESYQILLPDQQAMITLYPEQMLVQFLNSRAMEKLPKTFTASFGTPFTIN